jgi:hypothetical protein
VSIEALEVVDVLRDEPAEAMDEPMERRIPRLAELGRQNVADVKPFDRNRSRE